MAVAVTPSTHTLRTCAEIRRTYGQRFIWTRGPAPRMSAPPPSSPHAGPTGGDSALAAAFGAWQRACTGAPRPAGTPHTQRAPPRTGPEAPQRQISSRRGSSPCASLFPQVHLPSPPPPLGNVATPAPNHRPPARLPPRKPSTRVHPCRDRPPYHDCDRPQHVSLPLDCTRPLTHHTGFELTAGWGYVLVCPTCQLPEKHAGSSGLR
jgi:hypothetical protein